MEELPFLQSANFSNNRLKTTEGCSHPLLEHLIMNFNEIPMISGLEPERLTRLHTLELRGNRLTTTAGLNLPNLKNLFLVSSQSSR
ncbi:hypothetical protein NP493_8189g00003 [Ridgeia piscesae]|uniref:Uncharacterized protein n=1 Tax=Ridgeia piscesae TaxID=27915 RepID=A0AAD9MPJ9_RIDPI|nr:hypothetical protein NP493_8189g00003 [Ridgeia piscesae]